MVAKEAEISVEAAVEGLMAGRVTIEREAVGAGAYLVGQNVRLPVRDWQKAKGRRQILLEDGKVRLGVAVAGLVLVEARGLIAASPEAAVEAALASARDPRQAVRRLREETSKGVRGGELARRLVDGPAVWLGIVPGADMRPALAKKLPAWARSYYVTELGCGGDDPLPVVLGYARPEDLGSFAWAEREARDLPELLHPRRAQANAIG